MLSNIMLFSVIAFAAMVAITVVYRDEIALGWTILFWVSFFAGPAAYFLLADTPRFAYLALYEVFIVANFFAKANNLGRV